MKVIAMNGFGSIDTFKLEERKIPSPKEKEVRIKIISSGFNPVDWKVRKNWYGGDEKQILGFDCSGIIDAIGNGVTRFKTGDEVFAMTLNSSNGSYSQYSCVPEELVAKKTKNLSFDEAAAIPLAAMTAYRATLAPLTVKKGDFVFIAGAGGGVGSFAVQLLRSAGITNIYTIARNKDSSSFLIEKMGFSKNHILIYSNISYEELKKQVLKMNNERFFNATFDFVGGDMKRLCLELTGYSGHFSTTVPEEKFDFPFWGQNAIPRSRNISVHQVEISAELGSSEKENMRIYEDHLGVIARLLDKNIIKPFIKVIGPFNVDTVKKAHILLENGNVKGKLVMTAVNSK